MAPRSRSSPPATGASSSSASTSRSATTRTMPDQGLSWDVVADLQLLLQFHFMQNALIAGTLVAIVAGAAVYFVVLRGQSFAAHMLSQVGFPGAAAGVLVHVSPVLGLIVFCVAAALGIGWMGRGPHPGHRAESAPVRSIPAFSL